MATVQRRYIFLASPQNTPDTETAQPNDKPQPTQGKKHGGAPLLIFGGGCGELGVAAAPRCGNAPRRLRRRGGLINQGDHFAADYQAPYI